MYKCLDCNREFDSPERYQGDCEFFWGRPTYDYYEGCPYCKSEDIEEISEDEDEKYDY